MAHTYKFAILQLVPFAHRDEVINIGVVVFASDRLDIRIEAQPSLVSYFGVSVSTLDWIRDRMIGRDNPAEPIEARVDAISALNGIRLSETGWFIAETDHECEMRIENILKQYVEKPHVSKYKTPRTTLTSALKSIFKSYDILGKKSDDINRHKIISNIPVGPSGKLHIDFLLKNGRFHATETLDFRMSHDAGPGELKNAALANVTFQHAKASFGKEETNCYLVYSASRIVENSIRPAIEIASTNSTKSFNLESEEDKIRYLDIILEAAGDRTLFKH